ncbi:signal peptidase I [Porticoccaceae bacterium]|nr:signal peptidase I [Porticoccaceae bacterium]
MAGNVKFSLKRGLKNNRSFILFVILYAFFRTCYADWSPVPTGSMEPTILPGDYLWIDKQTYGPSLPFLNKRLYTWATPSRGDVITFVPPHTDKLYVKRVIGVPGDTIRVEGLRLSVNGVWLEQSISNVTANSFFGLESIGDNNHRFKLTKNRQIPYIGTNIAVPEGKYFVMGDHRNNSADSRFWGFVDQENVMGKVTAIAVSFSLERDWFARVALDLD